MTTCANVASQQETSINFATNPMPWVPCGPISRHIAKLTRPNRNLLSQHTFTRAQTQANQPKGFLLVLVMEAFTTRIIRVKMLIATLNRAWAQRYLYEA